MHSEIITATLSLWMYWKWIRSKSFAHNFWISIHRHATSILLTPRQLITVSSIVTPLQPHRFEIVWCSPCYYNSVSSLPINWKCCWFFFSLSLSLYFCNFTYFLSHFHLLPPCNLIGSHMQWFDSWIPISISNTRFLVRNQTDYAKRRRKNMKTETSFRNDYWTNMEL